MVSGLIDYLLDLQKTPANAAKASIRITAQENHTFTFTSASARDDQQATTSTLQAWIEAAKSSQPPARPASTAPAAENGGAPSASMVMAQTATGLSTAPRNDADTYDDAKLMADSALQKSLIASNPVLRQRLVIASIMFPAYHTSRIYNTGLPNTRTQLQLPSMPEHRSMYQHCGHCMFCTAHIQHPRRVMEC